MARKRTKLVLSYAPAPEQQAKASVERSRLARDLAARTDRLQTLYRELSASRPCGLTEITLESQAENFRREIEAFCTNNAEGSSLSCDEATRIVRGQSVEFTTVARRQDAADMRRVHEMIVGMYAPHSRTKDRSHFNDWFDEVCYRHAYMFQHRTEWRPGMIKIRPNFAGREVFAEPNNVPALLMLGHELAMHLPAGLPRAVMLTYVVVDVHPFADGNGRSARLVGNAELLAAKEQPCVVTFRHRAENIEAMHHLRATGDASQMIAQWLANQRWTASRDWGDEQALRRELMRDDHLRDQQGHQ